LRKSFFLASLAIVCLVRRMPGADTGLDYSQNLFTVLAALNAAGYDADIDSPLNNPLRKQLREHLAKQNIPVLPEIREFYKSHPPNISSYFSFALSLTGPPEYAFRGRSVDIPPDAYALERLLPLITRFYVQANIAQLWPLAKPAFEAALEPYHEPLSRITLEVNSYLRNPAAGLLGRHFQVYVDLLAAPNQIQTRSYGDDYYVIVTSAATPKVFDLRHAYLHFVVEPLSSKYGRGIMNYAALSDYVAGAPGLEDSYKNDFLLLTTESLIKAIECRLDKTPAAATQALHEGYILTPYFYEALGVYEKQPVAMRLYFPEMIDHIETAKERKRIEVVAFTAKAKPGKAPSAGAEAPVTKALTPSGQSLQAAETAYSAQDYEKAKNFYLKALEQRGDGPDHARAYYGLAHVALRQKEPDPELAEKLFQKTLEMSPDPQTQTWCEVYLGRLSDASGERDEAVKHYQAALAVKGGSDQARAAAEKGIQEKFRK
jgi:tetratricopeptide (TPR) repeat protein